MKIQYSKEKKNVWHSIRITLFTEYFSKDKFSNLAYALFFLNRLKYEQEMVHTVFHFQKALLYDVFVPNNRTSCFSVRVNSVQWNSVICASYISIEMTQEWHHLEGGKF